MANFRVFYSTAKDNTSADVVAKTPNEARQSIVKQFRKAGTTIVVSKVKRIG